MFSMRLINKHAVLFSTECFYSSDFMYIVTFKVFLSLTNQIMLKLMNLAVVSCIAACKFTVRGTVVIYLKQCRLMNINCLLA